MSTAQSIERILALQILRGERLPGSQLPPVRELATRTGVATPTLQRAIDRLEAGGLVQARRGSGVTVCDPRRSGDLSLLPLWFEALADRPQDAAQVLADFLELRRVVMVHLVRVHRRRIVAAAVDFAPHLAAVARAADARALAAADLAIAWAIVDAVGQRAVAAVLQACQHLVHEVPAVTHAIYGDHAAYRRGARRIAAALLDQDERDAPEEIDRVLAAWDKRSVEAFLKGTR
jgi:DNA-binding FadR family transcriptional regulator